MSTIPLRKIFKARRMLLNGFSVKHIAKELKISESSVRLYTKAEMKKVKEAR